AATAASLILVPQLGVELMPMTDSGDLTITVKMPPGTSLEKTNGVVKQVEGILKSDPNVNTAFSAAGTSLNLRGAATAMIPFQGSFQIKLKEERKLTTFEVMTELRKKFAQLPGARVLVNQVDLVTMIMTGGPQNVEVDIFGSDLTTLSNLSKDVMGRI